MQKFHIYFIFILFGIFANLERTKEWSTEILKLWS